MALGGGYTDVDQVLAHLQRHEMLLWSLIDAQHELRSRMKQLIQTHPEDDLFPHQLLESFVGQCETHTWQIVPINIHLRMKLVEYSEINSSYSIVKQEPADDIAAHEEDVSQLVSIDMQLPPFAPSLLELSYDETQSKHSIGAGRKSTEAAVVSGRAKQKKLLEAHSEKSHDSSGGGPYACDDAQRPYACDICEKRYAFKYYLRRHMDTHKDVRLECTICGRSLKTPKSLDTHMRYTHQSDVLNQKFACHECGKEFGSKRSLEKHTVTHSGERPFACTQCDHRSVQLSALKKHMARHSTERPFECPQCHKSFQTSGILRTHTQNTHFAKKEFECGECGKRFAFSTALKRHALTHTGEKPYACAECGALFNSNRRRMLHTMKMHTGVRPFECDVCQEGFVLKQQLTAHLVTHTGINPFTCDQCGQGFTTASNMRVHKRELHSEQPPKFKCDTCAKEFTRRAALKNHQHIHTGEKRFSCEVCDKRFMNLGTARSHMRVHTGEMPFVCDVCGRRFSDKRNMTQHSKKHAAESKTTAT